MKFFKTRKIQQQQLQLMPLSPTRGCGAWMERCVKINLKDKLKEETLYYKEVVIYLKDSIRKVICLHTYNKH